MNVDDESKHPWLRTEKTFIEEVLGAGNPLVGICLGGQLTAQVLGARVKNAHQEIGWHEVHRTRTDHPDLQHWPATLPVFQWHSDHFGYAPGWSKPLIHQQYHRTTGVCFR